MKEEVSEFKLSETLRYTLTKLIPLWIGLIALAVYYVYNFDDSESDGAYLFFALFLVYGIIRGFTNRTVVYSDGTFLHLIQRSILNGWHSYTVTFQDIEDVFYRGRGLHFIFQNKCEVVLYALSEANGKSLEKYIRSMIDKVSGGTTATRVTEPFNMTMPWWDRLLKVLMVIAPFFIPVIMVQTKDLAQELIFILALAFTFFIGLSVIRLRHLLKNPYIFTSDGYFISRYEGGVTTTVPLREVERFKKGNMSNSHALYVDGMPQLKTSFLRYRDMDLLEALFNADRENTENYPTSA
ncbi:hypothetical protein AB9P05_11670 [Roseivirga sp. BDSF3-8]|uniref:hypothetical protein n=1 Tax=Roseivirga sp. BDSF3-8 TaxID=3241598 RepID=UPI0035325815